MKSPLICMLLAAAPLVAQDMSRPRVFVNQANDAWSETAGIFSAQASTHPQTIEIVKTFAESCPYVIVTNDPSKGDYTVNFERESNKTIRRHNKFAAFDRYGDVVYASSTINLGNAVRGFCKAIYGKPIPRHGALSVDPAPAIPAGSQEVIAAEPDRPRSGTLESSN